MITRLYAVELRRLGYRRTTKVMGVALVALTLLIFGNLFLSSADMTDEEVRQRQQQISEIMREGHDRSGATFGSGGPEARQLPPVTVQPTEAGTPSPGLPDGPDPAQPEPSPEMHLPPGDYYPSDIYFDDPRFRFREEMPGLLLGLGGMAMVAAFAFGATAAGADWSAGTVQALLFWEPRRVRVMLTKVAAVATFAIVAGLAMQVVGVGLGSVVASLRGNFDGVDSQFWQELLGRSVRVAVLPAFTALLAFGIAGFTRNTGFALGVGFLYFAVIEALVRGYRPRLQPYLVVENTEAWVRDGVRMQFPIDRPPGFETFYNSGTRAATVLAVYLAVVLGVLIATFARRDVT